MYSRKDLGDIVNFYRQEVKPTRLRTADDVKKHPNDVLMSYLVARQNLSREDIARLMRKPKLLERWLRLHSHRTLVNPDSAFESSSLNYGMSAEQIGARVTERSQRFCMGFGYALLFANKKKRRYKFPSGKTISFSSLRDEQAANVSAFEGGYGYLPNESIYVRDVFVRTMLALMDVHKDDPKFAKYRKQMKDFDKHVEGIVIAHEVGEMDVVKSGDIPKTQLEVELAGERKARKFLKEQGVDLKYYELFHLLRATKEKSNVSRKVVEKRFKP